MTQEQIDKLAEALRRQGLTWAQTNFAVSLVRNAVYLEREACAKVCENLPMQQDVDVRDQAAAAIRARGNT